MPELSFSDIRQPASTIRSLGVITRWGTRACLLLLALNAVFLAIRFGDNLVPKSVVRAQLSAGFASGAFSPDAEPRNMFLGHDQGSDCNTAQLAVLGGEDAIRDAIAPRVLVTPDAHPERRSPHIEVCGDLKHYLDGGYRNVPDFTYTRFWQGQASFLAAALTVLPVDGYRALLLNLTLGLIALAGVLAARTRPPLLTSLAPLLATSFLFDGQMSFGHLFSHGPAHLALWSFAVSMIALRDRMALQPMLLLAIASGATEAFVDQLISVPLIAGSFLVVGGTVLQSRSPARSPREAAIRMGILAAAWFFGFAGSYAIKLLLSVALLGKAPLDAFVSQLAYRAGTTDPDLGFAAELHASRLQMLGHVWMQLTHEIWKLGYGDRRTADFVNFIIFLPALYGWANASRIAVQRKGRERAAFITAGAPYWAAAALLILWVAALPEHTLHHGFMERSFILLLVGGWGWIQSARSAGVSPILNQDDPTAALPLRQAK